MVKALHRAGIEVILDVVYNHTAEGNHLGPMLSFRGIDNESYYRLDARRRRASTWTTRAPATASTRSHPSVLRLIMDSLRYFVGELPRRRLPLRPRLGARARVPRGRPALGLLRHHPPGPDPLPGEADRRAVGRRRGRLPGRQLPGALDGVERDLPRRDARLLARRRRSVGDFAYRFTGLGRPLRAGRPASRSRRSTSSPPTTASRSRDLVSYNDKHNEANLRGATATAPTTTALELRRRGPDRRPRGATSCASGSSGTSSPRCSSRRACRCCSRATRSGARRAATTTPTARTTRSRGSTGTPDERQERLLEFTRRLIALRREHPVFRRSTFLAGVGERTRAARRRGGSGPTGGR